MPITTKDLRSSTPLATTLLRSRKHNVEDNKMNEILQAIEKLMESMRKANEEILRSLFEIQKEQLNVRRELVSIQREEIGLKRDEMNLKVDTIKGIKEVTQGDDLKFLREMDALDNEYINQSIERAKKIQEFHNEAIFK
jgi:hypothetical protein